MTAPELIFRSSPKLPIAWSSARSTPKAEEQRQKAGQEVPVESRSLKVLAVSTDLRATYRVQLHAGFGFAEAAAIADYLAALGISHLYCSPYLQAATGSTHGYDVANPHQVNKELGGPQAHAQLCATLKENGLGQVLDTSQTIWLLSEEKIHGGGMFWRTGRPAATRGIST